MHTHRTLMIARMDPSNADAVAALFAESDVTELPRTIGVTRRSLFHFNGIYAHLIETERTPEEKIAEAARRDPLFRRVARELDAHITPYDPLHWSSPLDSRATPFYTWTRD